MSNARNLASLFNSNYLGMKNILINGDFRVWQKGTDLNPAVTGNQVTGVDRWTNQYVDFSPRIRKVEDTINGETVDTAEVTKLSGGYGSAEFTQKVETNVAKYLRGQTVTFSFWVKKVGSTFGSHSVQFWLGDSETVDDGGWTNQRTLDRSRTSGVTGSNTVVVFTNNNWTKYSVTRTLSADTNTIYCTIYSTSTPTSEGIRIAKAQLELGSIATPFEKRPYGMELSLCQRYYQKSYPQTQVPGTAIFGNDGIQTSWGTANPGIVGGATVFPVVMRSYPTLVVYDNAGNAAKVSTYDTGAAQTDNRPLNTANATPERMMARIFGYPVAGLSYMYTVSAEL